MNHGTYIGDRADLKDKTALLHLRGEMVGAQFDDMSLGDLAHGWTEFPAADWSIDEESPWMIAHQE